MPLLRLTQHAEAQPDAHRVEVALEGDGFERRTATVRFAFRLGERDPEELRWYFEEYLQHPADPAPTIAARVERRMVEIGEELFRAVFQADDDAREIWAEARSGLGKLRIEIAGSVLQDATIPWELIRDPRTGAHLALEARAFVRGHTSPAERARLPSVEEERIRILLVICRPGGRDDVPFRSVASRLIQGLREDDRRLFDLEVLRPATYDGLASRLRRAKEEGRPFHVVHFDGHGVWADASESETLKELLDGLSPHFLGGPRTGRHGYLVFEHPGREENASLADGPMLGRLLAETDVHVLVLNACRSAHLEPSNEPDATATGDRHSLVRSFGSLAQEVMDAGAAGVVAMRYNVYVATAAQLVADLYAALGGGAALGEAVTRGRKQLHDRPERSIPFDVRALQDWPVPVVYEAASVKLFPPRSREHRVALAFGGAPAEDARLHDVPRRPDTGFFGRDETLLAVDRAFDAHSVVLLHAYAGSGKTTAAAELARWYVLTGGAEHALFTSFAQRTTLSRALETLARAFEKDLRKSGIDWLVKSEPERRAIALDLLRQVRVVWIWDNVEPVAGFPAGTESTWSAAEQAELADFLRDARETKAKFLLTSRRDERAWLGDLPRRVAVPPMPLIERLHFAQALGELHGKKVELATYRPLLRFTEGNPLTLLVVVRQALRDGLATREQIDAFVAKLRAGERVFEDEAGEGRSRSLGASLAYGFEHAFSEEERRQVAVLHLFQAVVHADVLRVMGEPTAEWSLAEIHGLSIETWIRLLDRAADVGVLTAYGGGLYAIHPAVPWYLKLLFDGGYRENDNGSSRLRVVYAYVGAMGELGNHYHNAYGDGSSDVIWALHAQEPNLLHARDLAQKCSQWKRIIQTMQGLRKLYEHTGRNADWSLLVQQGTPWFFDSNTDDPLPEREEEWPIFVNYRVRIALRELRWDEAERLQHVEIAWNRAQAAAALDLEPEVLNDLQRNRLRSLAVSLEHLGHAQLGRGDESCVRSFKEAGEVSRRGGDRRGEARIMFNLGEAYMAIPGLLSLDEAEQCYWRSLGARAEGDRHGRGICMGQLAILGYKRFEAALQVGRPKEELLNFLNDALDNWAKAIDLLPEDAVSDIANVNAGLGIVYGAAGNITDAQACSSEAIRLFEQCGQLYDAGTVRFNLALRLAKGGRFDDARLYGQAALRNLEGYGDGAADLRHNIECMLTEIKQALANQKG